MTFESRLTVLIALAALGCGDDDAKAPPAPPATALPAKAAAPTVKEPSKAVPVPVPGSSSKPEDVRWFREGCGPSPTGRIGPMCYVPAGSFRMGEKATSDYRGAAPVHDVELDTFYIDRHEVTAAEYGECVDAGTTGKPAQSHRCTWGDSRTKTHPINCIAWADAKSYCEWVGKRLPTEAEWEKAARGTDGRMKPWGKEDPYPRFGNFDHSCFFSCGKFREDVPDPGPSYPSRPNPEVDPDPDGWACTAPVESYPAGRSPYGAFDMTGNVAEWTADWHASLFYKRPEASGRNPTGPASGDERVIRGGSYATDPIYASTTHRGAASPGNKIPRLGVRCVLSAEGAAGAADGGVSR